MADIKILKANGVEVHPVTHEDAVVNNLGLSVGFTYQPKTDNSLKTSAKTVAGGINEINSKKVINDAQNGTVNSIKIRYVKNAGARIYPLCHASQITYTNGETLQTTVNALSTKNTSVTNRVSTLESTLKAIQTNNTSINTTINTVSSTVGKLSNLQTSAKNDLVAAVNEINQVGLNLSNRLRTALISKGLSPTTSPIEDATIEEMVALIESEDVGYKVGTTPSYTVENVPGSTHHFTKNTSNRWVSQNKGVHSSVANAKVSFYNPTGKNVTLNWRCYTTDTGDYGLACPLNTVVAPDSIKQLTGSTVLRASSSTFTKQVLTTAKFGFFYIKYIKNATTNSNEDNLRFEILFQ
jgi:hypothetical protein